MPEPIGGYAKKRRKPRPVPPEPGQSMNFRLWVEYRYTSSKVVCQKCGRIVATLWKGVAVNLPGILWEHRCKK